jgi:hypothetical protein
LPLAGEGQPNAFFLSFVLWPPNGVFLQTIFMEIMAGLAILALIREVELGCLSVVVGDIYKAISATKDGIEAHER